MERPSKRILVPIFLISVIVPVSLFFSFNHSSGPSISREIFADITGWNYTRPNYSYDTSRYFPIEKWENNSYMDDVVAAKFKLFIASYYEKDPAYGNYLEFISLFSANLSQGFIYKLQIRFSSIDDSSVLDILGHVGNSDTVETRNLSVLTVRDYTSEPYVDTKAVGQPNDCYLKMYALWRFFDENSVNHEFTAIAEIILNNGLEYVKIQIPISLGVLTS